MARHQLIHSYFARCTHVPWHSLTSMMSCLALDNDIHHWSVIQWIIFMLDIDTFIRMIRIVPLGLVAGEDYTLFHDLISSCSSMFQLYESTTVPLSYFLFSTIHSATVQIFSLHILWSNRQQSQLQQQSLSIWSCSSDIFHDLASASAIFLLHSSSTCWVSGGMLFSKL